MNALRLTRAARFSPKIAVRTFGHDAGKTSGPQHIHKHPMWDLPFNKATVYGIVWGGAALGTALIAFSVSLSQYKAGIWFKSSE